MEYIVAQYRIRTSGKHSDIVGCGIRGFAPFQVEDDATQAADMEVYSEVAIDKSSFGELTELSAFEFENELAHCVLYGYSGGYLFEMIKDSISYLFSKESDSNIVNANFGTFESVDSSLLRFGMWLMFGLCTVPKGAIAIHSSVLIKNGKAVLCLGESGTGKSTHTRLWREHFGDRAVMVNDDKPLIRVTDDSVTVYGTPWNGKHMLGENISVPLGAICILERAEKNSIVEVDPISVFARILSQTYRPPNPDAMCKILAVVDKMLKRIPVYRLGCNMDPDAVLVSYNGMKGKST